MGRGCVFSQPIHLRPEASADLYIYIHTSICKHDQECRLLLL